MWQESFLETVPTVINLFFQMFIAVMNSPALIALAIFRFRIMIALFCSFMLQ